MIGQVARNVRARTARKVERRRGRISRGAETSDLTGLKTGTMPGMGVARRIVYGGGARKDVAPPSGQRPWKRGLRFSMNARRPSW